ncbi:hypothetical protein J6590_058462 [Homalodisca vitripennis]|nr:hypothetical protein J6590_058462 [Homalodisca vitripennis]
MSLRPDNCHPSPWLRQAPRHRRGEYSPVLSQPARHQFCNLQLASCSLHCTHHQGHSPSVDGVGMNVRLAWCGRGADSHLRV